MRSHSSVEIHRLLIQISSVAKSLLWRLSKLSNNIKNYNIITFLDFIVWKCIDFVNIFLYLCKYAHVYRVVCQWVWVSMELNLHTTMSPPNQVLRTVLGSSVRVATTLNHWAISSNTEWLSLPHTFWDIIK